MVRAKRATLRGSFNSVSATRSEVGSVAFDDAVENAITDASCVSRKKAIGDRRASTMSNNGKTMKICTTSAASTKPTNAASRTSRSQPKSAERLKMKQKTTKGARRMRMLRSRIATTNKHTGQRNTSMNTSHK